MPDKNYNVTAVIVTYHSLKTIGFTLDSLKGAHDIGLADVVIVDNASTDGTADFIAENYPWVTFIRSNENVGFGRGCNHGSGYVKTPYLMFLNPDAVIDIQSLQSLIDYMDQHPRTGMCGPVLKDSDGERFYTNILPTPWKILLNPLFRRFLSRGKRQFFSTEESARTEWLYGACMFLRKDVFNDVGGFDPRFFLYFEETDLSLRIQQSGCEIWIVGGAICDHVNAASAMETKAHMIGDTISEHYFKSRFYYMVKHFGWFLAILAEIGEIFFMSIRAMLDLVRGNLNKSLFSRLQAPVLKLPTRID